MVMEAPPSPQCVGREFVRQYYTLLNQAPAHLHRFYNNNSSFVHGGLDAPNRETKPVVGQKQIHQKIQQLNFRDCHAKISQVDSQATLGDGVVVQVTGELSNSGQPMRRFTQTFVLAAQSPKKYYVHNDIFRYQDMICSDEETEQESGRSDAEEDADPEHSPTTDSVPPTQPPAQQQTATTTTTTMAYYNNSANTAASNNTPPVAAGVVTPQPLSQTQPQPAQQQPQQPQPQQPQQQQPQQQQQQPPQQQQQQQPPPPQIAATTLPPHQQMVPPPSVVPTQPVAPAIVNGTVHPEEAIATTVAAPAIPTVAVPAAPSVPQQPPMVPSQTPLQTVQPVPQAQIPMQQPAAPAIVPPPGHPGMIKSEEEEDEPEQDVGGEENEEEQEVADEQEGAGEEDDKGIPPENEDLHHHNETVSNEPKTYATLVKSGGTGVNINTFASTMSTSTNSQTKPTTSPPPVAQRSNVESRDPVQVSGMQSSGPGMMSQGQRGRGGARGSSIRGMTRNDRGGPGRGSFNEDTGSVAGDGDRRRMGNNVMQQYSDSQQLFMGNLPHHATEDDLKELFSKFGAIIDLRIHSKQNAKSMAGGRVPNYGFIIFEDAATVQIVLNSRPIYFPSEGGQKLNVEEKKTRPRPSVDGGRMGSGGDNMMGRPNSGLGGSRSSGPGGMMRGGPGMGHHRGGGRGMSRGDGRGGVMHRGGTYARR